MDCRITFTQLVKAFPTKVTNEWLKYLNVCGPADGVLDYIYLLRIFHKYHKHMASLLYGPADGVLGYV